MKVYLAARYARNHEMRVYADQLLAVGIKVTARWINGDHENMTGGRAEAAHRQRIWALEDWADLMAADVVISFTEPPGDVPGQARGGRHVEFGAALATGKRCIVVGFRENVFHHLPFVEFQASWGTCLSALANAEDGAR